MSYSVEVIEKVEFTFKRKVLVDKLIGIKDNLNKINLVNLDDLNDVFNLDDIIE